MTNNEVHDIHDGKFTFFWDGPFSQWYHSEFVIESGNKIGSYDYGSIRFVTTEQYMMFKKASLFEDHATATLILQAVHPRDQKRLGRSVMNFEPEVWEQECGKIVYDGNYAKFTQNPNLYRELMATGDSILVEASPYDKIWGIGLSEEVARITPVNQWQGTNWLGEVLTSLRDDLRAEERNRLQALEIDL